MVPPPLPENTLTPDGMRGGSIGNSNRGGTLVRRFATFRGGKVPLTRKEHMKQRCEVARYLASAIPLFALGFGMVAIHAMRVAAAPAAVPAPAPSTATLPEAARRAAVSVRFFDAAGKLLRTTNGLWLREGVVVPYDALSGADAAQITVRGSDPIATLGVSSTKPDVNLALLEVPPVEGGGYVVPSTGTFRPGAPFWVARGPSGEGDDVLAGTIGEKFSLRGPDFLSVSTAFAAAAPAFKEDGSLLGVTFDLSEDGYNFRFVVTTASLLHLVQARRDPEPFAAHANPVLTEIFDRRSCTGSAFRGSLLLASGATEDARNYFNLALKLDPRSPLSHFGLGQVLFREKSWRESAVEFKLAGDADSTYHMAWHMCGAAFNQGGDYKNAVYVYKKALAINPASALSWTNIGGAYYNLKDFDSAIVAFGRAKDADPTYWFAYFNLAMTYKSLTRYTDAEAVYIELKEKNPGYAQQLRVALDAAATK